MSDHDDDFGREIAQLSAQFLSLAQLAQRNGGFRDKSSARKLRDEFTALGGATRALLTSAATQDDVNVLAQPHRTLMGLFFDEIRMPGGQPQ